MTEAEWLPPDPEHTKVKLYDSVDVSVKISLPLVSLDPDHAPEAEQLEALAEDQEIVTPELTNTDDDDDVIVIVGVTAEVTVLLPPPPPLPPQETR